MNLEISKKEIINRKVVKVYEDYQKCDGFDMAFYAFELDSGVIFSLPYDGRPPIQAKAIDVNQVDITHKLPCSIKDLKIKHLYIDVVDIDGDLSLVEVDDVVIELASDLWLSNQSSAPHGVEHTIGIYIESGQVFNQRAHNLLDFWEA